MKVFLIQHGSALDKEENPDRPLSAKGVRDVEAVALFLQTAGVTTGALWHSGKTRAKQTAERLAFRIAPSAEPVEQEGLGPEDPVGPVLERLAEEGVDTAVVGHLPFLSKLASLALTGGEDAQVVAFRKGGVVCLESEDGRAWQVRWMLVPDLL